MDNHNEHEELERNAPVLFSLPKADPFVVPEEFFARFPHEVQAAVVASTGAAPARNWWKRAAIALPILVLMATAAWWMQQEQRTVPQMAVEVTPLADEDLDQLDDADLLDLLAGASATESATLGQVDLQLNETELLAYLDYERADLTDLITDTE